MAIQFARAEYKGRSTGGNAVRSSAYNERDVKMDEKTGEVFDFRDRAKPGDIHLGAIMPEGVPKEYADSRLWNMAEKAERRKDSQVAKEVVIALPKEMGPEDWKVLAVSFAKEHFVSKGVPCQIDIHAGDADDPNPHAHILIATRRFVQKEPTNAPVADAHRQRSAAANGMQPVPASGLARDNDDAARAARLLSGNAADLMEQRPAARPEPVRRSGAGPAPAVDDDPRPPRLLSDLWEQVAETAQTPEEYLAARRVLGAMEQNGGPQSLSELWDRAAEMAQTPQEWQAVRRALGAMAEPSPSSSASPARSAAPAQPEWGFEATKARDLDPVVKTGKGKRFVSEGDRWGEIWAAHQNEYFKAQGLELRVDPLKAKAEEHLGPKRHRGAESTKPKQEDAKTKEENAKAWRDPARVLEIMTANSPTFRKRELDRQLKKNIPDAEERAAVRAEVLAHADLVEVFDGKTGLATGRFTTRQVVAEERQVMADADALAADRRHRPAAKAVGKAINSRTMRADQQDAFHVALNGGGFVVIQGRAGVGKSYTLGALAETYRESGYTVIGLAPQHSVRLDMEKDQNMRALHRANTLHSEVMKVEKGSTTWNSKTVILVDEAGMADTKIMARLLAEARKAGAKVILTGDDRQLQSVARGGMFKVLAERHDAAEITEVTRQKVEWQRQAAEDLSGGKVSAALTAFDQHGQIKWAEDHDAAVDALVAKVEADTAARPDRTRFTICYTNADVHCVNEKVRAGRASRGELGHDVMLSSEGERKAFATADRVQIIKTDKEKGLFNGTVGTVESIKGSKMTLALDGGGRVTFDTKEFDGFRHGYAGTIYKSQGRTLDEVYMLHSKHWRMESTYVAMTRQKYEATIFVGRDQAEDLETLIRQCSREDDRRAATGYCTTAEEAGLKRRAWEAAAEKVAEADAYARGEHPSAARARTVRGLGDTISRYIEARGEAGELWADIQADGMARHAQDHDGYPAFEKARESRDKAVKDIGGNRAALSAMVAAGIVSPEEFAADHLMATGCPTRAEAIQRARGHALDLGIAEPTALEKFPAVCQAWKDAMATGSPYRADLKQTMRDLLGQIDPSELQAAPKDVQAMVGQEYSRAESEAQAAEHSASQGMSMG